MIAPIDIKLININGRIAIVILPIDFKARMYDSHHMTEDKIKFTISIYFFCSLI